MRPLQSITILPALDAGFLWVALASDTQQKPTTKSSEEVENTMSFKNTCASIAKAGNSQNARVQSATVEAVAYAVANAHGGRFLYLSMLYATLASIPRFSLHRWKEYLTDVTTTGEENALSFGKDKNDVPIVKAGKGIESLCAIEPDAPAWFEHAREKAEKKIPTLRGMLERAVKNCTLEDQHAAALLLSYVQTPEFQRLLFKAVHGEPKPAKPAPVAGEEEVTKAA